MLLVCLSHFGHLYLSPLGLEATEEGMSRLTLAATPAFLLVSGLVLGFLHSTHRGEEAFRELRRRLLDRALFLLTVAHVLIVGAHLPKFGFPGALAFVFITDVVAVCVIVGTAVVPAVRARSRIAVGGALYVAATLLALLWMPAPGSIPQLAKHLLVGHWPTLEQSVFVYNFPILQWLALYLVATALGETLRLRRDEKAAFEAAALAGLGGALMGSGAVLRVLRPALYHLPTLGSRAVFLTSTSQKLPPGPAFLLCYSGLALCLVAGCLWLCRVGPETLVVRTFGLIGRNSLVVFVLQYLLYYCVVDRLALPFTRLWPLLFAATFGILVLVAWFWERAAGGRFLTVGLPAATAWAERLTSEPRLRASGSADPGSDDPPAIAPRMAAD